MAVLTVSQIGNLLQGSSGTSLQGSTPTTPLQGSSPVLQPTVNPAQLPPTTVIHTAADVPVVKPATTPAPVITTPAVEKPDKTNDINFNKAALDASGTQNATGLSAIQATLDGLISRYGSEATDAEGNYTEQSNTNKNNQQRNTQAALINAAQGRRGLFGILASIGALNGSGINLANRAVQTGANEDITGANDTFGENQTGLDTAIGTFRTDDARRKEDANKSADASRTDLTHDTAVNNQKIYSQLADDYSAMGDEGNAKMYSDLAAALFPQIAQTSASTPALTYAGAAFTPSTLSKYVGGDQSTQVQATPASGPLSLPGLVAGPAKKRIQQV